jgi:hypothetical protein
VNGSQYQVSLSGGNVTCADFPAVIYHHQPPPDMELNPMPSVMRKFPILLRVWDPRPAMPGAEVAMMGGTA